MPIARTKMLSRWASTYTTVSIRTPTDTECAYIAGLIDGEGYFQVSPKTNAFGLGVSMTDREPIVWLHERIGGRVQMDVSRTSANRLVHRWGLQRHSDLRHLLPLIEPYLLIKGPQAHAMLRLLDHLSSYPEYDIPTSRSPKAERDRRRIEVQAWRQRGIDLRLAVRNARHSE